MCLTPIKKPSAKAPGFHERENGIYSHLNTCFYRPDID